LLDISRYNVKLGLFTGGDADWLRPAEFFSFDTIYISWRCSLFRDSYVGFLNLASRPNDRWAGLVLECVYHAITCLGIETISTFKVEGFHPISTFLSERLSPLFPQNPKFQNARRRL